MMRLFTLSVALSFLFETPKTNPKGGVKEVVVTNLFGVKTEEI